MRSRALALIGFTAAAVAATGCETARYYGQAIGGQWELVSRKQPIADLVRDAPDTCPLRERLQKVQAILAFAESRLGLPVDGAYSDYVDLGRPYVVWNVLAAPEFSLQARTWWYPIVGSLEYRGYFDKDLAVEHAERLRRNGEDAYVGGVAAYSTLGWFDDPVLNTFINRPDSELAELLFHELAHRRLFIPGDTDFNEAFATAVGREGVNRWINASGDPDALARYRQRRQRDDRVIALILGKREQLACLYESADSLSTDELRARKAAIIDSLRNEYGSLKRGWSGYRTFDKFMASPINNARLNAVDTYYELVPKFERLIARHSDPAAGGDLTDFFELVESTRRMSEEERRVFLDSPGPAD